MTRKVLLVLAIVAVCATAFSNAQGPSESQAQGAGAYAGPPPMYYEGNRRITCANLRCPVDCAMENWVPRCVPYKVMVSA